MQTYRIYVADIDTGCTVVEATPEDAKEAWEGLRESSEWGWLYGPVTVEEEWQAQANGWVREDDPPELGFLSRLRRRMA